MEEDKILKKMTPLEFVNYLKGYFMIIGERGLSCTESSKIIEMLKNVEKEQETTLVKNIDDIPSITSPSVPDPTFYHHRETSVPDPNFYQNLPGTSTPEPIFIGIPDNICYNYTKNKKEDKK